MRSTRYMELCMRRTCRLIAPLLLCSTVHVHMHLCVPGIWLAVSVQAVVHQFGRTKTKVQQLLGTCAHA